MVLLQLVGQGAMAVASLALGLRLLGLWRRTHEVPELSIGLSFLLGGGLGYLAWFALAVAIAQQAPVDVARVILLFGLACSSAGSIANGVGIAVIFRPGAPWARLLVGGVALWVSGAWGVALLGGPERASAAFWACLLGTMPIYLWACGETFALARALHKRARLGLADPVVVHRIAQWGVSCAVVVLMSILTFAARLAHGPLLPPPVILASALLGLVAAVAIWLGFFPPRALRERLASAYAG